MRACLEVLVPVCLEALVPLCLWVQYGPKGCMQMLKKIQGQIDKQFFVKHGCILVAEQIRQDCLSGSQAQNYQILVASLDKQRAHHVVQQR